MPDLASSLPAQFQRNRTSRRSRPSLAAFTDSGYAPSCQPVNSLSSRHATLTRSSARSTLRTLNFMREESVADGSDPFDLGVASQLTEESFAKDKSMSFRRDQPPTIRSTVGFDGEEGGTIRGGTLRKTGTAKFRNNFPSFRQSNNNSGSSQYPQSSTISRSATISSAWSCVSNRLFVESFRAPANVKEQGNKFIENFDMLARKHGIQPFPKKFSDEPGNASVSSASGANSGASSPTLPGNKFLNMLLRRTPSTIDVSKQHGNTKLTKKYKRSTSANDLEVVGRGRRDSLKGMHLEDMIRLGGVAIFNLPLGLSPGDLLIPTCMHAAASYILNNGIRKQGIFRVSGNVNTTFALYDFYQRQLEENNNESVVATTALARLPTHIQYTVHDVAHLLKKLIYGLPGGLLGAPPVFQALYNVHAFVYPDPSLGDEMTGKVKPRMIALAISAINLHFRITLVCAVFGLLRAINLASEQETHTKVKDPHETFVQMRDDSLGTVFAPLLLGDKSKHILVDESDDRGGLLVLPALESNVHSSSKKHRPELHEAKKEAERMRRAALVAQMLIDNWEDVAYELKRIQTLSITAEAYDLPVPQDQNTIRRDSFKYQEKDLLHKSEYAHTPEITGSKKFDTTRTIQLEQPLYADTRHPHLKNSLKGNRGSGNWSKQSDSAGSQQPFGDLLRFDSHKSNRKALDQDLFLPPVELGMSPIAESIKSRPITTPPARVIGDSGDTPNWRVFSNSTEIATPTKLASPIQLQPDSSPNWRNITASTIEPSSPNWLSVRTPSRSDLNTGLSTPNWRVLEQPTGNIPLDISSNWRNITTPSQAGTEASGAASPNWRPFPAPLDPEPENSPNWRLINTDDEAYLPNETPVRKLQISCVGADPNPSLESTQEEIMHSSGTSSGAATPPPDVTPQIARRFFAEFSPSSTASFDDLVSRNSLALSAPAELGKPEPEKRKPSIYGRRAVSPVREISVKTDISETPTDIEDAEDSRPSTPRPLTYRKKPSGFSIYEDEQDKTPKAKPLPIPVDSPVLSLRKPNSQMDIKITTTGKKPAPSREVSDSPNRTQGSSRSQSASVPLQPSSPNRKPRPSIESDIDLEGSPPDKKSSRGGNTTLYAEIRRLQRLVDLKTEEANSTRKELELAQNMAKARTLSHIVRETQEELKMWKNRAEWAEQKLRQMSILTDGQAHRYSMT